MSINYTRWLRSYVGHQRLLQLRAGGFVTDSYGQVLLGRRADVLLWDLPGGTIDLGETPSAAVVRQLDRETGLQVVPEWLIGVYSGPDCEWTYPNGDQVEIVNLVLQCRIVGGVLDAQVAEHLQLAFFAPNALPALLPRTARILADALAGRVGHCD